MSGSIQLVRLAYQLRATNERHAIVCKRRTAAANRGDQALFWFFAREQSVTWQRLWDLSIEIGKIGPNALDFAMRRPSK